MNNSEEYRRECEARHVLKWSKEKRGSYYQDVKAMRGQKAAEELIAEVNRQFRIAERKQGMEI